MKFVSAIVVAAGKGLRFKSRIPKLLAKINSKPLIVYSLSTISKQPLVKEIIVVVNSANRKQIFNTIRQYRMSKITNIVTGGRRRQDSVNNGLKAINKNADLVLIHDAARPFIDKISLASVINEAAKTGAAIVGVPVKDTIKKVRSQKSEVRSKVVVKESLDRENLWEIQTPQVFDRKLILKAYKKMRNASVTDDAMLAENIGLKVSVVLGSYNNIKITTKEDLVLAHAIAKKVGGR